MEIIRIVRIGKISDQNRIGYSLNRIIDSFEKKTLKIIWQKQSRMSEVMNLKFPENNHLQK